VGNVVKRRTWTAVLLALLACGKKDQRPEALPEAAAAETSAPTEVVPYTRAWWEAQEAVPLVPGEHYAGEYFTPGLSLKLPSDWEVLVDVDVEEQGLPLRGGRLLHALPQADAERGAMDAGLLVDLLLPAKVPQSREDLAGVVRGWLDAASSSLGGSWTTFLADEGGPWEQARKAWPEPVVMASLELPERPRTWVVAVTEGELVYVLYAFMDVHPEDTLEVMRTADIVWETP
jgi:hypothetical protein